MGHKGASSSEGGLGRRAPQKGFHPDLLPLWRELTGSLWISVSSSMKLSGLKGPSSLDPQS